MELYLFLLFREIVKSYRISFCGMILTGKNISEEWTKSLQYFTTFSKAGRIKRDKDYRAYSASWGVSFPNLFSITLQKLEQRLPV